MPYSDLIVFALILLSLVGSLVHVWRRGLRGRRYAITVFAMFYSLIVIDSMVLHCLDVLYGLTHHLTSMTGKPFAYDWRTYSLLLFGALMIWFGARCLGAALRMARGDDGGRTEFLRLDAIVLLIVLPIVPVHPFFGPIASIASAVALVVVGLGGWVSVPATVPSVAPAPRVGA